MNKIFAISILFSLLITACNNDDDITPTPVNEQELITTVLLTFTPVNGGNDIIFIYQDMDGAGPTPPEITEGKLSANTTYNVSTLLLNETKEEDLTNPEYNITIEVAEEGAAHQMFYRINGSDLSFTYADKDVNNKPIGIKAKATTGDASNGNLTVTLRHMPDKNAAGVETGDITNAGGETDIEVTFDIIVE